MNHTALKFAAVLCTFFFFSCATAPERKEIPPPAEKAAVPEPPVEKPAPLPPPVEPAAAKPDLTDKIEDASLAITHEKYEKTFEEVNKVIDELNSIIKAGDYNSWKQYLTEIFIQSVMDPENLKQLNEQPLLQRNNIVLKTLGDYFTYVVVPSRASVRLDDLIFTDEKRVRAFMILRKDRVLIYQLENIDSKWRISTW